MMRFSQGPTLTFRGDFITFEIIFIRKCLVKQYSIARHILSSQKRPAIYEKLFKRSPLVVMNGFNQEGKKHLQLVQTYIQNMFPTLNIDTVNILSL